MGEWVRSRLGDLAEIKHGFAFKGEFFHDEPPGDFLLTPGNFAIGGGFQWGKRKYYRGPVPEDYVLSPGDLLVTMTDLSKEADTLGYAAVVPQSGERLLHNQRLGKVNVLSDSLDKDFLHWLLRSQEYRNEVLASYTGTTVKHTSPNKILAYEFMLPPLHEQRAIAAILDILDNKIQLNQRMGGTLEAIVRATFDDWFVSFGPTRAKMGGEEAYLAPEVWALFPDRLDDEGKPVGWSSNSIYDFTRVVYGAPFSSRLFNDKGLGLPLIRIRDLSSHDPSIFTDEKHPNGHVIDPGDIVVGMDGEFRMQLWKGPPSWLNQRVCHFEPHKGIPRSFVSEAIIDPLAFFERGKVGTTVIHLGKSDIDTFKIIHPGAAILDVFGQITEPLHEKLIANALESRKLTQTRDLLLPKLMSGGIRLKEAERLGGEVT